MKVYLIGYMGVGKTTLGKRLSALLGLPFTDLDAAIEAQAGTTIAAIFAEKGEPHFREMEHQLLSDFADNAKPGLLSTGGGAPMHHDNMERMLRSGVVVWLQLSPEMLASRLLQKPHKRPMVQAVETGKLPEFIAIHLKARTPTYQRAHLHADAGSMDSEQLKRLAGDIALKAGGFETRSGTFS